MVLGHAKGRTSLHVVCLSKNLIQLKLVHQKKKDLKIYNQIQRKHWSEVRRLFGVKVLNAAYLEESLDNQMLASDGLVGNKSVTVLKYIGCSGVIEKKDLVKEKQHTSMIEYVMTVARNLLKAPFANVDVSTLFYARTHDIFERVSDRQK